MATNPALTNSFDNYALDVQNLRYAHVKSDGSKETWEDIAHRVTSNLLSAGDKLRVIPKDIKEACFELVRDKYFIPGGRVLSQTGREYHQTDNCYCLRAENTREGWGELAKLATIMFMSGGGVGVDYSDISPYGTYLKRSGGIASGPLPLIELINAAAKAARQGGERRGAHHAMLRADHPDIHQFIEAKRIPGYLEHTNMSVGFTPELLVTHRDIFHKVLYYSCKYGEPNFQFDADNQTLRNACTEIISDKHGDSCCLGSLVLPKVYRDFKFTDTYYLASLLLICNTLYTHTPADIVTKVKDENRRLGLGMMGWGEWFIQQGVPYGTVCRQTDRIMWEYQHMSSIYANNWADYFSISRPIATRAIAPTGTISVIGGTTPGIEPLFHTAYIRTYNTLKTQQYSDGIKQEVVIENVVQKLLNQGYDIDDIDTAYTLSQTEEGIARRIRFQAYVQGYVDNAVSSTVNLPYHTEDVEDKVNTSLLSYLPYLRGITFYPDGARSNQPVQPISIKEAVKLQGKLGQFDVCNSGVCGV